MSSRFYFTQSKQNRKKQDTTNAQQGYHQSDCHRKRSGHSVGRGRYCCAITPSAPFEAVRHPVLQPVMAVVALVAFLSVQWALPLTYVYAQSLPHTQFMPPQAGQTRLAQAGPARSGGVSRPANGHTTPGGVARPTQRGALLPSDPLACGVGDCQVSMRALDLRRAPTERELRRAGQLGGALNPTRSADVVALAKAGANAKQMLRLRQINTSFGQAIQEWNKHHFKIAARMFAQHVTDFPDSPWAGESLLHLGCDARYNGRFAESAARYDAILKTTSEDPRQMSYEIHQKAKLRWADLDISTGKMEEASLKLSNLLKTDHDWRRRTWAHYWLHQVGIYKQHARDLRACGTQALSVILASLGKPEAAKRLANMRPTRSNGFSLAELERIAAKNGVQMRSFRATAPQLAELPTPFLIHYDFTGTAQLPAAASAGASWSTYNAPRLARADVPVRNGKGAVPQGAVEGLGGQRLMQDGAGNGRNGGGNGLLPDERGNVLRSTAQVQLAANPFQLSKTRTTGHFLVVRHVDKGQGIVNLYDPQEHRLYHLSYADLAKEWSGTGLVMVQHGKLGGAKAVASSTQHLPRLAWLSDSEKRQVIGGCCGVARAIGDLGGGIPGAWDAFKNWLANGNCGGGQGSPQVTINRMTLNMFIYDTPLWYHNAIGPDVNITMNYNSLDALNQNVVFGNKWVFNYGSYAVEDTESGGGVVTIFMPDGAQRIFYPTGSGGYNNQVGVYDKLTKTTPTHYELTSPTGEKMIYDIPAGTDSLQPFLVEVRDRWGYGLHMGYEVSGVNIHLTTITDAIGRVTHLTYDDAGHIVRVDDPFGRHATFRYDHNGNMIEVVDMDGNAFQYTYDADVLVTRLNTAQGVWKYDTLTYNTVADQRMYVNVTDPRNQTQRWVWDGLVGHPMAFFDRNNQETQYYMGDVIDGKGTISKAVAPTGDAQTLSYDVNTRLPNMMVNARGKTTKISYNALGQAVAVVNPKQQITRFNYDPRNGLDLLSTVNPQGQTLVTYQYNDKHQPTLITDAQNHQTQIGYTPWGAVSSVTDTNNHHTVYNYDPSTKQLMSIARDGVTLGSYTYDSVGRVRTSTNTAGITLTYDYNDLDRPTKITYPDGTFGAIDYACCGLPGVIRDRAGRKTYFDYDEFQRLARVQDAAGHSSQMDYDAAGNVSAITDALGRVTRWQYDNAQRPIKKTYPNGSYDSYTYDVPNNVVTHRDPQGKLTRSYYDDSGNLTRIDYPDTPDVSFLYDSLNRPYKKIDGLGTTIYHYDTLGRVDSIDGPWANDTITYHYDDLGRRDWMKINGTDQTSYHYDALGRMDALSSPAGTFTYGFVGDTGRLSQWTFPNGSHTHYSYDNLHRPISIANLTSTGENISHYNFGFDSPGYEHRAVVAWREAQVGSDPIQHLNYGYDAADQLTAEVSTEAPTPAVNNQYAYDAVGNRTQMQSVGAHTTYNTNSLNQYTGISSTLADTSTLSYSFSYDVKGNFTGTSNGTGGLSYRYDSANRLIGILKTDPQTGANQHKSEFVYDGADRKVIAREYNWDSQANTWSAPTETRYVYDGMDVVQERDGNNQVKVTYTRSGNIGGLLARSVVQADGTYSHYYYHYDGSGNVVQLTDANQQTVARYTYDAYGNGTATGPQSGQPYRFQTKEYHPFSGLYAFGLRYYSPALGRWLSRDPIREIGGMNLYAYVNNKPLNQYDAYGECVTGWQTLGIIAAGTMLTAAGLPAYAMLFGPIIGYEYGQLNQAFNKGQANPFEDAQDGLFAALTGQGIASSYHPGGGCFVAGTPVVMGDGSTKPIEQVKQGELVFSRDAKSGKAKAQRVQATMKRQVAAKLVLHLAGGEKIETTQEHPFYVEGKGFIKAGALGIGNSIVTRAGPPVKIEQLERVAQPTTVYNLRVDGFHTYFVGLTHSGLWVHNADDCPTTRVGRWMSPEEHEAMNQTGTVQEGAGGTTSVANPADPNAFMRQAAPGSHYVEFNVPTESLKPGGRADWAQIPGPNSFLGRVAARSGNPIPGMPPASDIVHVANKLK